MPTIRSTNALALSVAATLLHGCAAVPGEAPRAEAADPPRALSYTVRSGDRLGDIAVAMTGKLAHWREIAAHNGIDDPRALRVGTVLEIPPELLPDTAEAAEAVDAAASAAADTPELPDASAADAPSVTVAPVRTNRDFELSPMSLRAGAAGASAALAPRRIRVLGSYYPKGVYAEPASYSRLLMRVAPGTVFELEDEFDDWYGVVTERGVGYLRRADGLVLDPSSAAGQVAAMPTRG